MFENDICDTKLNQMFKNDPNTEIFTFFSVFGQTKCHSLIITWICLMMRFHQPTHIFIISDKSHALACPSADWCGVGILLYYWYLWCEQELKINLAIHLTINCISEKELFIFIAPTQHLARKGTHSTKITLITSNAECVNLSYLSVS